MQDKDNKKEQEKLPLTAPEQTSLLSDSTDKIQKLSASDEESKKQSVLIQSEQMAKLLDAYRQYCQNKKPPMLINEDELKADKGGKVNLTFDSPEDMTDFFKKQAESGHRFIMIDAQTNKVIAFSNGDGKLYRQGKDGVQEITAKSVVPDENQMNDLPDYKGFTLPEPRSAAQSNRSAIS